MVEESVLGQHIEGGVRRRHRQRVAAEGAAMATRGHGLSHSLGREDGAAGETARNTLGTTHDVRGHTGPFVGEQLTRAPETGLHLIEDQQQAQVVGYRAQLAQITVVQRAQTALALHWLDDDGGRLRRDHVTQCIHVLDRHNVESVGWMPEAVQMLGILRCREHGHGPAVE